MAIVINGSGTVTGLAVGGLPDGTVDSGTIATGTIVNADINDLAASKLTGALPAISGASLTGIVGGKVLQVVSGTNTTNLVLATSSWIDYGLSVAITPSATTSKVLIQFSLQCISFQTGTTGFSTRIVRNSTALFTSSGGYSNFSSATTDNRGFSDMALDSPSLTSAITYKVQVRGYNAYTVSLCDNNAFQDTIIATEIGA